MDRFSIFGRRSSRFFGAVLAAAVLTAALPTVAALAADAPPTDQGVDTAVKVLDDSRRRAAELEAGLDLTAAQYEQANAHLIRIKDELAEGDVEVAQAQAAVVDAEEQLSDQVAAVYKHPREEIALTDALLQSPDAPSALHRAALYRRLVNSQMRVVKDVKFATSLTTTDVRQERIIAAGAAASAEEWRRQSVALSTALREAQEQVRAAESGLEAAKQEAARRAAEQRRQDQLLQVGAAPSGPAPSINGRACPVGTPNGFIDSWGFPRSGGRTHEGVDMFAPYGTPLYAAADGVIYRVYNNALGGLAINLIDTDGNMYYYAHLSSASVKSGQKIGVGQVIGAVGTSGNAAGTPPHVHWQFHPGNGEPVNPYPLAYALCR